VYTQSLISLDSGFLTVAVALKRSLNMLAALEQSIPGKLSGALGIYTNLDPDMRSNFSEFWASVHFQLVLK